MGLLGIVRVAWKAKEWSRNDNAHSGVWEAEAHGKSPWEDSWSWTRYKLPGSTSLSPRFILNGAAYLRGKIFENYPQNSENKLSTMVV